jgi:hypothetical protein
MALQHAYGVTNLLSASAVLTWSDASAANVARLYDGRLDKQFALATSPSGGVNLIVDFGSAVSLSAIAVLNSSIASASGTPTLKVEGADNSAITVGVVNQKGVSNLNTTAPRHKDHVLQFPAASKRYWRLTWTWTGTHNLKIGELFMGTRTALTRAIVFGSQDKYEIIRSNFRSATGESRGHFIGGPIRTRSLPFEDLSETQRNELYTMWAAANGGATPLLWCESYESTVDPAAADYQECIYGRFEEAEFGWSEPDYELFTPTGLSIRSLGREVGA